ncbi:tetratricopeptide repeat protein, partial [Gemmatimonadota bacterium]
VVDTVGDRWSLSDGFFQGLFVVLAIGFFVALVLAWYHGEKGRQRVSGPELLMIALLLVIAGTGISILRSGEDVAEPTGIAPPATEEDDRPTIAVLPLENLSPDPDQDFFASGVQEDLTSKLQRISTLAVISRTSVERYRDPADRPPLRQIASELGADYLLEGSARIGGDSVRITVQLIKGETDVHLWADDYDAPYSVEYYVRLQSEIVQRIASDLRAAVSPEDRDWLEAIPTGNLEAYEAYMRGNEAFRFERQVGYVGLPFPQTFSFQSIGWFEQAVRLDPGFSLAHARLALALSYDALSTDRQERIRAEAETALALLEVLPEARLALGRLALGTGQIEEALRQFNAAVAENPNHSGATIELARLQQQIGDVEASIQSFRRAEGIDPSNPIIHRGLTRSYMLAHRYDDALRANAKHQALAPGSYPIFYRAWIHLLRGAPAEARSAISEMLALDPAPPTVMVPGFAQKVVLRLMTSEERRTALSAYEAMFGEGCESTLSCYRNALHEQEVGSASRARIYLDSLRMVIDPETIPRHTAAVLYQALESKESALEAARQAVTETDHLGDTYRRGWQNRFLLATVLTHFGEHDAAIDLLEGILPAPSWLSVPILEIDPIWDPLRDHPRFQALLERYADDVGR